jgi:RNA polymerase-binding transcription factor DksA
MNASHKEELEAQLAQLTEELSAIGIHNPENPSDWIPVPEETDIHEPDPDMVADSVEAWDERQALVATLETEYNNIRRALKKIEEGTYGTCEINGEPIEADRLDANPSARTCKKHMDEEYNLTD